VTLSSFMTTRMPSIGDFCSSLISPMMRTITLGLMFSSVLDACMPPRGASDFFSWATGRNQYSLDDTSWTHQLVGRNLDDSGGAFRQTV
jgi:hypothetical protein